MSKNKPTEGELQILQVLWAQGPSTVRTINEIISAQKPTGYTTTLKLMQIMVDKGLLSRDTSSRTHVYAANISEADTQKNLLSDFLASAFRGSASSLVMQALGQHKASQEELDQIKELIQKIENQD